MYKDNSQLRIEDVVFPYGKLDPENDWVRLAALVPWDGADERYAARFVNNGPPAHPARMALGALLIPRRLKCSGPMAGEAHRREPVPVIFHQHEGVRTVSVRGVHAGGIPETVQRERSGGNSGGICSQGGDSEKR